MNDREPERMNDYDREPNRSDSGFSGFLFLLLIVGVVVLFVMAGS